MGIIHKTVDGSSIILHSGENCPCEPQRVTEHKTRSNGRYGRHQGYKVQVTYLHNPLPAKVEA